MFRGWYWLIRTFVAKKDNDTKVICPGVMWPRRIATWPLCLFGYKAATCYLYYELDDSYGYVTLFYRNKLPHTLAFKCYRLESNRAYLLAEDQPDSAKSAQGK